MKVKVNSILKNVYGEPLKSQRKKPQTKAGQKAGKSPELEDLTLREIIVNSVLNRPETQDKKISLSQDEELRYYRLAIQIQDAKGEVDLTSNQIVEIKESILNAKWPRLITGQALDLIEP
jgi:hypothetical protein